ncbi:Protein IMPACT [Pleurostoma richardsiae]|uniref:Protein IMPACT n=1 Tax=Pleurostoma richardsiae TaxID=41990 RepID=A0AA38VMD5_9PEZI|nr:Protein IMPACT [Pleurostoma richardsiae]
MATQQDLQELLRLQTARKLPMMQAMGQIRALQGVNLRSIQQIAEAPLATVETALKDPKAARAFQNACKAHLKRMDSGKRPAPAGGPDGGSAKRVRQSGGDEFFLGPAQMTPQQLESSLELPVSTDEEAIARAAVQTNRAPLVLAFAVELLRYTMPEQPPSSRLSLAQAVVSANSRSKAVSIGLEKGPSADDEGWGEGQPRIRVLGREIAVLKRGGYEWKGEETVGEADEVPQGESEETVDSTSSTVKEVESQTQQGALHQATSAHTWAVSQPVSLKSSTFIARAAIITDPSQRQSLLRSLLDTHPNLKSASHNAWAYRIRPSQSGSGASYLREESFDDGETGCGDLMLRIMRDVNAVDTMVVMTRWFGGVLLGPDRWRLMRNVVTSALAERLRKTGAEVSLGGEAVWGLDLEGMKAKSATGGHGSGSRARDAVIGGMQIHRPEAARNYLLKSFATAPSATQGANESPTKAKAPAKKTLKAQDAEKEENLGLLLGAIRLLYDSWADHLTPAELDRRAWSWYVAVRPEVEHGPSGWGAKGTLNLADILKLRRQGS